MMFLQSPLRTFRPTLRSLLAPVISHNSPRYASLNSAIGRGIRRSQRLRDPRIRSENSRDSSLAERRPFDARRQPKEKGRRENREEHTGPSESSFDSEKFGQRGSFQGLPEEHQRPQRRERQHREYKEDYTGTSNSAFTDDKYDRRGSFRALPQDQRPQRPQRSRFGDRSPSHKGRASRYDIPIRPLTERRKKRLEWKAKHDSEQPPMTTIDEDEFIKSGSFRAVPQERSQRIQSEQPRSEEKTLRDRENTHERGQRFRREEKTHRDREFTHERGQRFRREEKTPRDGEFTHERGQRSRREEKTPRDGELSHERGQRFRHDEKTPRDREFRAMDERRPSSQYGSRPDRRRSDRDAPSTSPRTSQKWTERPERVKTHVKIPDAIPYTTPASEFIYGTTAVEAALRCSKRQLYKLYLYQAGEEELGTVKSVLQKLALAKNVKVKIAFAEWDRLLDKMSLGRPHNGCVLEASPLPKTPVLALKSFEFEQDHFRVSLAPQTQEEALVNGTNDQVAINFSAVQQGPRHPVVLLLDGVVDPGNLGAIIRSAYYLGADAVIFAGRNSAPLTPITIKASAGAAENMTLLTVKNEVDFIQRSKANGWQFYAADAPEPGATYIDPASIHTHRSATEADGHNAKSLIGSAPSVIMMGNEGSGLSRHILSHADSIISIPGARIIPGVITDPARVDSLNVSVAAALLMETFLRVPLGVSPVARKEKTV